MTIKIRPPLASVYAMSLVLAAIPLGCDKASAPAAAPSTEAASKGKVAPTAGKTAATATAATATAAKAKAGARPAAGQPSSMPTARRQAAASGANGMPPGHGAPTSMPAGHGKAGPGGKGLPPGHPAMPPGGDITGTLKLDPKLKADVKAGAVLFLVARRDAGGQGKGMLLAAKKVPIGGADMFPFKYRIGQKDVMMQGTDFNGAIRISARVDGDGDALSKNPGDITGKNSSAVPTGTAAVNFTLDTKL
jgi:hypothetical protein